MYNDADNSNRSKEYGVFVTFMKRVGERLGILGGFTAALFFLISGFVEAHEVSLRTPLMGVDVVTETVRVAIMPAKDNTIYEENDMLSNGRGAYLFAGNTNNDNSRRGLIAFDVADRVPVGTEILTAELRLNLSRQNDTVPRQVSLYRLETDWGEGASDAAGQEGSGATVMSGDATWSHRFYSQTMWITAGGDVTMSPSAVVDVGQNGEYQWSSPQMVSDVQSWLDTPDENYGWQLRGDESTDGTARRFDSKDNSDPTVRPMLFVEYMRTTVPVTAVEITGPLTVTVNRNHLFTATVTPMDTSLPLTYTWKIDDLAPQLTAESVLRVDVASLTWMTAGTKMITVTADNGLSLVTDTLSLTVLQDEYQLYLPHILSSP